MTRRGTVIALLFLAVAAGGGYYAWKSGLFGTPADSGQKDKDKKGGEDPKKTPEQAAREALIKALGVDGETEKAATLELDSLGKDGAAKVAGDIDKQGTVDPFRLLDRNNSPALAGLFSEKRLSVEEARAARAYLAGWRMHLAALRKASLAAKLPDLEMKLPKESYALRLLAELGAGGQFKPLDVKPGASPVLPWFGPTDQETAALLQKLLADAGTPAGRNFVTEYFAVTEPNVLQSVLAGLGDKDKLAAFDKAFAAELRAVVDGKVVPNRDTLDPIDTAVVKLAFDLQRGLKLPKAGKP